MSTDFSTFTKTLAVVLIITVCVALVPSKAFAGPCESEKTAKRITYAAVWVACGFMTLRCIAAILDPTRILVAYCILGGAGCATAATAYIAAKKAYDDCMQRYNIAGAG